MDDALPVALDGYSSSVQYDQTLFQVQDLKYGTHELTLYNRNDLNPVGGRESLYIDYFEITGKS